MCKIGTLFIVLAFASGCVCRYAPSHDRPEPRGTNTTYVVEDGQDLYAVAVMFNVSPSILREANGLRCHHLPVGRQLTIPPEEHPVPKRGLFTREQKQEEPVAPWAPPVPVADSGDPNCPECQARWPKRTNP
jgi:hypothetical protein